MDIKEFTKFVSKANAVRRIRRIYPVGGDGSYVAPPTYLGSKNTAVHVFETRRIDGKEASCVLLDSVQSQANRLEEALQKSTEVNVPNVYVDFRGNSGVSDIGTVSSLECSHRIFDAIIRDSKNEEGENFLDSAVGKDVSNATVRNALALFRHSPTTLVFGGWNSTGDKGGNGPRFQRCLVSEIIGVNVPVETQRDGETRSRNKKPSSRIDPLEIEKVDIWQSKKQKHVWEIEQKDEYKKSKPSEVNHGNIAPSMLDLGVTIDYAIQTTTITLAGLRRLSFPDGDGNADPERDLAAQTILAAVALCAITENDENGYSLRSRCDLYPKESDAASFEIIENSGHITKEDITPAMSRKLLADAVAVAKKQGLPWETAPIRLVPQEKLVELVKKSRSKTPDTD